MSTVYAMALAKGGSGKGTLRMGKSTSRGDKPHLQDYNVSVIMGSMAEQCTWTVDFYFDARDRSPVLDFITALPKREQAKLLRALGLLQEFGSFLGMPHARPIDGKLGATRGRGADFLLCPHGAEVCPLARLFEKDPSGAQAGD